MSDPTTSIEHILRRSGITASPAELVEYSHVDLVQGSLIDMLYTVKAARYIDPALQFEACPIWASWYGDEPRDS